MRASDIQVGEMVGQVTVRVAGSLGAPLVVCLHGFPDTLNSYRHQLEAFVGAGYQVACPALPGYEPASLDPLGRYDMERVSERLLSLIRNLQRERQAPGPVHLVGHDWGAIAGFACVNKAPTLFRSYTSLSIPYNLSLSGILRKAPAYIRYAWYIQLFQIPGLAERLVPRAHWAFIDRLMRDWSPGWRMPAEVREGIKLTLAQPGVLQAALGYYRAIPGFSAAARRSRRLLNDRIQVPTLLIEGVQDGCIHTDLWRLLDPASFTQGVEHRRVMAGHFPHQEAPSVVNEALLAFWPCCQ